MSVNQLQHVLQDLERNAQKARAARAFTESEQYGHLSRAQQRQVRRARRIAARRAARLVQDALLLGAPTRLIAQTVEPRPNEQADGHGTEVSVTA